MWDIPLMSSGTSGRLLDPASAPDLRRDAEDSARAANRDCWAWAGWEPDRYYRRLGRNSTPYFGNGAWLTDWRKRLQKPETLRELQELGVTMLVTRFFKGFGPQTEAGEWDETRAFVRQAQNLGLKVWGYQQGGSLFGETLFRERPEAREWVAKTREGRDLTWGASYFRFLPCLSHPGYQAFFLEILEHGIRGLRLDGIHVDNNYYRGCHCERCTGRFREWLSHRPDLETLTGLPETEAVDPPPLDAPDALITDPLRILWIEFNVDTRRCFYERARRHLKSLRADAVLCANPAWPRNLSSRRNLSLDPSIEGGLCDVLFAENGSQPGWKRRLASQAEAHLLAEAGGYRTLSTSWLHRPDAWRHGQPACNPPEDAAGIWTGLAEEFSYFPAALGNNWMLRSACDRDRILADTMPAHMEAFREAMAFFRNLETQASLPERRTWGEYGVLLNPVSLSLCGQTTGEISRAVIRYLQLRRLPFRVLFSVDEATPEMRHLIACQQLCLSDAELAALLAFAGEQGKSVTLLGDVGRYNEWFIPRNETDWRARLDRPGVRRFPLPLPAGADTAKAHMAESGVRVGRALRRALDAALQGGRRRVRAPYRVLMNWEIGEDYRCFLHLRDQSTNPRVVSGARIFAGDLPEGSFEAFFPAENRKQCLRRPLRAESGWVSLPPFERYCLLSIQPNKQTP